jgi:hypothetical protein
MVFDVVLMIGFNERLSFLQKKKKKKKVRSIGNNRG